MHFLTHVTKLLRPRNQLPTNCANSRSEEQQAIRSRRNPQLLPIRRIFR